MQIFLVRHGQDLNPDQGRLTDADPSLSELGKEQAVNCAIKIKEAIGSSSAPIIISSPRTRTMETASVLAEQLGQDSASIKSEVRLKERDCSAYSGQLINEVFSRAEEDLVSGGMEAYSRFEERLSSFYNELLTKADTHTIIVTHSGNIEPFVKFANIDQPNTLEPDDFVRLR